MKILFLLYDSRVTVYGGFEKVFGTVIEELVARGHQVQIGVFTARKSDCIVGNWVPPFSSFSRSVSLEICLKLRPITLVAFLATVVGFNYPALSSEIASLVMAFSPDAVIATRNPLIIPSARRAITDAKVRSSLLFWNHGDILLSPPDHKSLREATASRLWRYLHKSFWLKQIDGYLSISEAINRTVESLGRKTNVFLTVNPVDSYNGPLNGRPAAPHFLFVGRLDDRQKNISFLLKSMSRLPDIGWRLSIVGAGPDELKLRKLSEKLSISEHIDWLGEKNKPYDGIGDTTAILLTSRWEGLPTVLIEAIQRGIPVISSDCKTGPSDIVVPGVNGYLYREGSMDDFLSKLDGVISGILKFGSSEEITATSRKFSRPIAMDAFLDALNSIAVTQ